MTVEMLRSKHPTFIYESFDIRQVHQNLTIDFNFSLEPDITFHPTVTIPVIREMPFSEIGNFAFHLGLIETISYWKATCSPQLIIRAGKLDEQQTRWWHDLFIHGLGEFFYRNQINFNDPDFLSIISDPTAPRHIVAPTKVLSGDLIMLGGGKDSNVTMEVLEQFSMRKNVFMLNPTPAAKESARAAGYTDPLIINRTLDKNLLDLNKQGYLNGHTPFSAYLAFLSVFTGVIHDYQHILASNEQSAGEFNTVYQGLEVNHQYSKSIRFERLFREYCQLYLQPDIQYFSFLRPLYELQIAKLFSTRTDRDSVFCSCNVKRGKSWCGECAKCAFVYLSLFPFLTDKRMENIFGNNFFAKPSIQKHIIDLVGLGTLKPFDCVGTKKESIVAVGLVIKKYEATSQPVPNFLLTLRSKLGLTEEQINTTFEHRLRTDWNTSHFLPPEYAKVLKKKLSKL